MRLPFSADVVPAFSKAEIDSDHVTALAEKLEQAYRVVRSHLQQSKESQAKQYNERKNVKFRTLRVGDLVFLHSTVLTRGVTRKLHKPWTGPYEVVEKINDVNYRIKMSNDRTQVVHINRLKLYSVGKDIVKGRYRAPKADELSDFSETETIVIRHSDQEDDYGEEHGVHPRGELRPSRRKTATTDDVWSSADELPLAELQQSQLRKKKRESPSNSDDDDEDDIPLSVLRERVKAEPKVNSETVSDDKNDQITPREPPTLPQETPTPTTELGQETIEPKYNLRSRNVYFYRDHDSASDPCCSSHHGFNSRPR